MPESQSRRPDMCLHYMAFDPAIALRQSGASHFVEVYERLWYRDLRPKAELAKDHRRIGVHEVWMQNEASGDEVRLTILNLGEVMKTEGG